MCFRLVVVERKLGCTELLAVLAWEPPEALVGLAVSEVQARLVVQAAVPLVV